MSNPALSWLPLDVAAWRRWLQRAASALGSAVSHSCGRTVLDEVEIPAYIRHAGARARRLVRQGRVSPW